MVASIVSIEKGLGPEGRIAVVRLDRGDKINALAPPVMPPRFASVPEISTRLFAYCFRSVVPLAMRR